MSEFVEKRKHSRIDVSIPLHYKELRGKSYLSTGSFTENLSEGGIRFGTDKFISLACHLVVEMILPSFEKPIKAISKIAWIKKLPAGNSFEVGNQFMAMSDEDEEKLASYVKNVIGSTNPQ